MSRSLEAGAILMPRETGRAGQPQAGADIVGRPMYLHRFSGVQYKDKDGRLSASLTLGELVTECKKATKLQPLVDDFTMATTVLRDETIQREAWILTANRQFPFEVYVWSGMTSINLHPGLQSSAAVGVCKLVPPRPSRVGRCLTWAPRL